MYKNIMEYGRSLFSQSASDAKVFLSDVYKRSTRAKKLQADDVQGGKSMIEMLGVLAVIGVLSVGGIAGYSKAMLMWHSNMQRNSLSELLHNMLSIKSNLDQTMPWQHFAGIIDAMGYTTEGLTLVNNGNAFMDRDGNLLDVQYGIDDTNGGLIYRLYIFFGQQSENYTMSARDYCHNVALVSQSVINDLQGIYVYYFGEKDGKDYSEANWLFKPQNLKKMKIADIHNACTKAIPDDVKRISHITISLNPL